MSRTTTAFTDAMALFLPLGRPLLVGLTSAIGVSAGLLSTQHSHAQQSGMQHLVPSKDCSELGKQMAVGNVSTDVGMTLTCNAYPASLNRPPAWMPYEKYCARTQGLPCNKSTNGL